MGFGMSGRTFLGQGNIRGLKKRYEWVLEKQRNGPCSVWARVGREPVEMDFWTGMEQCAIFHGVVAAEDIVDGCSDMDKGLSLSLSLSLPTSPPLFPSSSTTNRDISN